MRIGMLTGGGDCPGLNAVIRGVVRKGVADYGHEIVGYRHGWRGVMEGESVRLALESIRGLLPRGGTILGTSRTNPYKSDDGPAQVKATLATDRVDALIAIGGEDTLGVAHKLSRDGVRIVGVPKTIDNDLSATDFTFGFHTAVQIATDAIDRLHTTAESHDRVMVVEVMGRHAGWIATYSVVAEGAVPVSGAAELQSSEVDEFGHVHLGGVGNWLQQEIEKRTGYEARMTQLGHVLRGGTPTAYDRVIATRFGVEAIDAVNEHDFGTMVALHGTDVVRVPIEDAVSTLKTVDERLFETAAVFFG